MVDATLQGVALGAGLLHTFSAENFLVTTLSAGVGSYLGGAFSITVKSPLYQQMLLSMSEAAATDSIVQGAEIGLGLSKKFDLKQMMSSMASAAMTTVISHYDRLETGDMERALLEAIPDGFGSALIGSAIMGKKFDVRQTIAQTIGTVIGTVAGMELRDAIRAEREPYPWLQKQPRGHCKRLRRRHKGSVWRPRRSDPLFKPDATVAQPRLERLNGRRRKRLKQPDQQCRVSAPEAGPADERTKATQLYSDDITQSPEPERQAGFRSDDPAESGDILKSI